MRAARRWCEKVDISTIINYSPCGALPFFYHVQNCHSSVPKRKECRFILFYRGLRNSEQQLPKPSSLADMQTSLFRQHLFGQRFPIVKSSFRFCIRAYHAILSIMDNKQVILHLGDPIIYNIDFYKQLDEQFTIIRPPLEERSRPEFIKALQKRKWGDFSGIMRPFWNSGLEMGRFDKELVPLLPSSLKVFASAGAGYDWADVDVLADHGILYCNGAAASSEAVADMALWHILSVFRNLTWSSLAARSLDPDQWRDAHAHVSETAHNPKGHIIGIVGLGNIGFTIARKVFAAFGA